MLGLIAALFALSLLMGLMATLPTVGFLLASALLVALAAAHT